MIDDVTKEQWKSLVGGSSTSRQETEKASCLVDFLAGRNEDDQVELLTIALETYGGLENSSGAMVTGRRMHDVRFKELGNMLSQLINGTLKLIIHTRRSPKEAAKVIRDLVFSFDDQETRDFVLAMFLRDDAVPYRPAPASTLQEFPSERLNSIFRAHEDALCQLRCIHCAGFGSTVEAELILTVLATVPNKEDQVGLLQYMIHIFKSEVIRAAGGSK